MKKEKTAVVFHDLLNFATSIRNILYILLMKKTQPDRETEDYLKDCLKRSDEMIKGLQSLQKTWPQYKKQ